MAFTIIFNIENAKGDAGWSRRPFKTHPLL